MNGLIGINEAGIDTLCEEIYKYADQMAERLDAIDEIVNNIQSVYNTDVGLECYSKVKNLREVITISCKNIMSYAEDLADVKAKFQKKSSNLSDKLQTATNEINK